MFGNESFCPQGVVKVFPHIAEQELRNCLGFKRLF